MRNHHAWRLGTGQFFECTKSWKFIISKAETGWYRNWQLLRKSWGWPWKSWIHVSAIRSTTTPTWYIPCFTKRTFSDNYRPIGTSKISSSTLNWLASHQTIIFLKLQLIINSSQILNYFTSCLEKHPGSLGVSEVHAIIKQSGLQFKKDRLKVKFLIVPLK